MLAIPQVFDDESWDSRQANYNDWQWENYQDWQAPGEWADWQETEQDSFDVFLSRAGSLGRARSPL